MCPEGAALPISLVLEMVRWDFDAGRLFCS